MAFRSTLDVRRGYGAGQLNRNRSMFSRVKHGTSIARTTTRRYFRGPEVTVAEVLVVDDSKVMRDMVTACLRPNPKIVVTQASSGLEAIEKLSMQSFEVVVLDLNMPDIGGLEVVEFVRSQDKLRSLPILIVTTRGDDASRANVLRAGATKYLTKPFTPDAILAEVNALMSSGNAAVG